MMEAKEIKFKSRKYLLIGDLDSGAIATKRQYEAFEPSYAHLDDDGIVYRNGQKIGTKEDIVLINKGD